MSLSEPTALPNDPYGWIDRFAADLNVAELDQSSVIWNLDQIIACKNSHPWHRLDHSTYWRGRVVGPWVVGVLDRYGHESRFAIVRSGWEVNPRHPNPQGF